MALENKDLPAFVAIEEMASATCIEHHGLTKREYFAAKTMQGLLARGTGACSEELAAVAVRCADALLKEL